MSSDGFVQEWQNEETSERVSFSDDDGIRRWEYCNVLTWHHDPDDPNSTWVTVEYIYGCETNLTTGTVMLGLEIDNPLPDQNDVYPPERVILEYWLTTNAVTRLATTNDMPKIDFSKIPTLTTNDVCNIVTNEVEKWSEWEWSDGKVHKDPEYLADAEEPKWMMDFAEAWAYGIGELADGDADSTRLVFGEFDNTGFLLIATRRWIKGANALGLAMAKDVEKKFAEATNAVASIVTNVVPGYTEWSFSCEVPEIQAALNANPPGVSRMSNGDEIFYLYKVPVVEGYQHGNPESWDYDSWDNPTWMSCGSVYYNDDGFIAVVATRKSITRNALGLARIKDIEKLPTHETVTNVARSVVNSVWDASLGVAWEARMHNGHLYYIAVTNRPPEVK